MAVMYFAYGTNINKKFIESLGVVIIERKPAVLKGYRLIFNIISENEGEGYANIMPEKQAQVEGALYKIPDEDVKILDTYENYPELYEKIKVTVETEKGTVEAFAYRGVGKHVREGLLPYSRHVEIINGI